MSLPNLSFKVQEYEVHLGFVNKPADKTTVTINGKNYQVLGKDSDEGVLLLKNHIANLNQSTTYTIDSFEASLRGIGSSGKTGAIFQRSVVNSTAAADSLNEQKIFNPEGILSDLCGIEGIGTYYFFSDIGAKCVAAIKEKWSQGAYAKLNLEEFVKTINADLYTISKDLHLRLRIEPRDEFTMETEMCPHTDHVGYIFLRGFGDVKTSEEGEENVGSNNKREKTSEQEATDKENLSRKEEYAASIKQLRDGQAKYVIIDLTENDGGSPDSAQLLCSYFMKENTPLSSIESKLFTPKMDKDGVLIGFEIKNVTSSYQTLSNKVIPEKDRLLNIPVYLLTSKKTFSAAEKFVNDMKLARPDVVLVGETTKGGANSGSPLVFGQFPDSKGNLRKVDLIIPTGHTLPFMDQENWEGKGISPNEDVSASAAASTAYETALKLIKEKQKKPHELE